MKEFEIQPVKQKMIYVYKHPDDYHPHNGWLKIGDQTGLDSTRIDDQNEADNIVTETLFQIPAIDIYGNTFRDYDIHKVLEFMGVPREKKVNNENRKSEWFKVDLETVKKAIDDRINCRDFFKAYVPEPSNGQRPKIKLREEQKNAVQMTYDYWLDRAGNPDRDFLWNAKPRFGKTLTAYNFAMKIQAERILIVTNRPAISDSWARDFYEHIRPEHPEYIFSSAKGGEIKTNDDEVYRIPSRSDILKRLDDLNRPLIFFISLQDIKGKSADSDDFKTKNQWIFDIKARWDLLIIDESHEGVKTSKTKEVLDKLGADFTLCLSGTPFKAIANNDFGPNQIFNWSYADEQESKADWDYEKGDNPYENLPRMNFRAYHMSTMMESKVDDEEACFDLSEFFRTSGGNFLRPGDVASWLDNISGISRKEDADEIIWSPAEQVANMPFDTEKKRDTLRHTFWLLPGVAECRAMKELLRTHPVFKDYDVVLAAGKGDDDQAGKKALDKVKYAIGNDPLKTKTITLSCTQLSTGITVPEWTAVFMLYGSAGTGDIVRTSSTKYLQAAFRAQNPWTYGEHKEFSKDDCYIFDFAPDRVLTIIEEYATSLVGNKHDTDHKPAIRKLLNYLSVISMDEKGEMRELDARDVVELPRKLIAKEIVDGGFITSNKLFNISNIFHATPEARQIINKLTAVKKQKLEKTQSEVAEAETEIDEDGNTIIDKEVLVNSSEGVLRKKEYEVLTEEDKEAVLQAISMPDGAPIPESVPEEKREAVESAVNEIKQEAKKKAEKKRKNEEDEYRDKLRGFARTIPMLLHAYGQPAMTFDDLEKKIPDDVFFELTDITKDEFRILRKEQYFNEDNCTVAIREFMKREEELADYFRIGAEQDIFDYIPMQRNNQVFTPKKVIGEMLDMLEQESPGIFKSNRRKFVDPYSKSGLFLSEIVKRLYGAQRKDYNSDRDCLMHILSEQIFAWSPNDILRKASISTVIGFMRFDRDNFSQKDKRDLERNFLNYDPIDNEKGEIKSEEVEQKICDCWGEHMKFDVIIGNPPYQKNDNGQRDEGAGINASASPLYHKFINIARGLKPNYLSMIVPSRWMVSGKGLGAFREDMLADHHIRALHDFPNDREVFPNANIDIKGGVCYFLWDYHYDGTCKYSVHNDDGVSMMDKYLDDGTGVVIRYAELASIMSRVWTHNSLAGASDAQNDKRRLSAIFSTGKPYGLRTDSLINQKKYDLPPMFPNRKDAEKDGREPFEIFGLIKGKRVKYYLPYDYPIPSGKETIAKWKVFVPEAYGCGAIGEQIPSPILGSPILGSPIQICSETFLRYGAFDTKEEAENALKYLKTKFFRCLVGVYKNTQHTTRRVYVSVPIQNFTPNSDVDWDKSITEIDQQLYKKYGLTVKEIKFIEEKVKAMD